LTHPAADILLALPHAAVLAGTDSAVLAFNEQAQALFPYLRDNQPLSFAIRDPELLASLASVLRDSVARRLEIVERLPVERAFAVHITPIQSGGALAVFEDLTASRRLEQMRVDFIANASHELRTPLASLLGFIETLKGSARNDAKARTEFLGVMELQAQRMARLIDDLLSLSRIELNAHVRPRDKVDLVAVLREIVDALRPLAQDRGVEIDVSVPPDAMIVTGDRDELLRVVENLLENAVKYGQSGGRVAIGLSNRMAGQVVINVRDFGPGIAAEHLPRLTERFYRVNAAASREAGGTGLGLAIVKHIVVRHRGHLEIDSKPGQGSEFRVILQGNTL
jgi:two-component system, OmpR family, phosphate regulon sensor histidine kinase PhoR